MTATPSGSPARQPRPRSKKRKKPSTASANDAEEDHAEEDEEPAGIPVGHFINEYAGEVYPSWLWSARQSIMDRLQRVCANGDDITVLADFWNMQLERHPEDPAGRAFFTIDPSHCANFSSRLSHSCTPNCQTACVAIDDGDENGSGASNQRRYTVVLHSVRPIVPGEELTIDYNAVTPSRQEFQLATCLCGSSGCRGSFLYLTLTGEFVYELAPPSALFSFVLTPSLVVGTYISVLYIPHSLPASISGFQNHTPRFSRSATPRSRSWL